jgi:hypothetical protein
MPSPRIILRHPHVDIHDGMLCYFAEYRLTEPVNRVVDGAVDLVVDPADPLQTDDVIMAQIKTLVVAHANLQTSDSVPFTESDLITWEK